MLASSNNALLILSIIVVVPWLVSMWNWTSMAVNLLQFRDRSLQPSTQHMARKVWLKTKCLWLYLPLDLLSGLLASRTMLCVSPFASTSLTVWKLWLLVSLSFVWTYSQSFKSRKCVPNSEMHLTARTACTRFVWTGWYLGMRLHLQLWKGVRAWELIMWCNWQRTKPRSCYLASIRLLPLHPPDEGWLRVESQKRWSLMPSSLFMPAELGIEKISFVPRSLLMKGLGMRLREDIKYRIQ